MKIGLVLPSTPGYSETFFTNKIKGLQANGHEVVLFVNSSSEQNDFLCKIKTAPNLSGSFLNVSVVSLWCLLKCLLFNFCITLKLFQEDTKEGVSFGNRLRNIIISSHILSESLDWLHFGFGTMAINRENVALAIGAKMAVSFRGFDFYVFPQKHKQCYSLLYKKDVKYHVLSEGMKKGLLAQGISEKVIIKITPAISVKLFTTEFIKFQNDSIQIATIARLHWIKGLEYTLEALALFKSRGIPFHYTIIGDGNEKERLLFASHQLGLSENITFAGKLPPEKVKEKLESADVYLQYSIQEGFCNAVLEAQAMGKICIVSDAEGLAENVIDGFSGFVVPKRKPLYLTNKIVEVIRLSENKKNTIAKQAVERVASHFSIEKQIKAFVEFYENV